MVMFISFVPGSLSCGKTAIMFHLRHPPALAKTTPPDIITVQITRGNVIDDFAADGQLASAIAGFKPREPQRQMAFAVASAIEETRPLVVEAGTGTGKTTPTWRSRSAPIRKSLFHRLESAQISSTVGFTHCR